MLFVGDEIGLVTLAALRGGDGAGVAVALVNGENPDEALGAFALTAAAPAGVTGVVWSLRSTPSQAVVASGTQAAADVGRVLTFLALDPGDYVLEGRWTDGVDEGPVQRSGVVTIVAGGVVVQALGQLSDLVLNEGVAMTPVNVADDFTGTAPITYDLAPSSAALPAGLTLSGEGLLSGTPTEAAAARSIVIRATGFGGSTADSGFSLTVQAALAAPSPSGTIPPLTLEQGVAMSPFDASAYFAGGAVETYSAAGLPTGVTINAATGVISGAPTVAGAFSALIDAQNAAGLAQQPLSGTVEAATVGAPLAFRTGDWAAGPKSGDASKRRIYIVDASYAANGEPALRIEYDVAGDEVWRTLPSEAFFGATGVGGRDIPETTGDLRLRIVTTGGTSSPSAAKSASASAAAISNPPKYPAASWALTTASGETGGLAFTANVAPSAGSSGQTILAFGLVVGTERAYQAAFPTLGETVVIPASALRTGTPELGEPISVAVYVETVSTSTIGARDAVTVTPVNLGAPAAPITYRNDSSHAFDALDGTMGIEVVRAPYDNGSALTAIQYRIAPETRTDETAVETGEIGTWGAWTDTGLTDVGYAYVTPAAVDHGRFVQFRAVNAAGAGDPSCPMFVAALQSRAIPTAMRLGALNTASTGGERVADAATGVSAASNGGVAAQWEVVTDGDGWKRVRPNVAVSALTGAFPMVLTLAPSGTMTVEGVDADTFYVASAAEWAGRVDPSSVGTAHQGKTWAIRPTRAPIKYTGNYSGKFAAVSPALTVTSADAAHPGRLNHLVHGLGGSARAGLIVDGVHFHAPQCYARQVVRSNWSPCNAETLSQNVIFRDVSVYGGMWRARDGDGRDADQQVNSIGLRGTGGLLEATDPEHVYGEWVWYGAQISGSNNRARNGGFRYYWADPFYSPSGDVTGLELRNCWSCNPIYDGSGIHADVFHMQESRNATGDFRKLGYVFFPGLEFYLAPPAFGADQVNTLTVMVTADRTIAANEVKSVFRVVPPGGVAERIVTLPDATAVATGTGNQVSIVRQRSLTDDGGTVTIRPVGGQTIGGVAGDRTLAEAWDYFTLYSDGSNWIVNSGAANYMTGFIANSSVNPASVDDALMAACIYWLPQAEAVAWSGPDFSNASVAYNAFLRAMPPDLNGDGVVDLAESWNGATSNGAVRVNPAAPSSLSIVANVVEATSGVGAQRLGNFSSLSVASGDSYPPASYLANFDGALRTDFFPRTRAQAISMARPKTGSALDAAAAGPLRAATAGDVWDYATGEWKTTPTPSLLDVSPAVGSANHPLSSPIKARFSVPLLTGAGAATLRRVSDGVVVASTTAIRGLEMQITPGAVLTDGVAYSVEWPSGVGVSQIGDAADPVPALASGWTFTANAAAQPSIFPDLDALNTTNPTVVADTETLRTLKTTGAVTTASVSLDTTYYPGAIAGAAVSLMLRVKAGTGSSVTLRFRQIDGAATVRDGTITVALDSDAASSVTGGAVTSHSAAARDVDGFRLIRISQSAASATRYIVNINVVGGDAEIQELMPVAVADYAGPFVPDWTAFAAPPSGWNPQIEIADMALFEATADTITTGAGSVVDQWDAVWTTFSGTPGISLVPVSADKPVYDAANAAVHWSSTTTSPRYALRAALPGGVTLADTDGITVVCAIETIGSDLGGTVAHFADSASWTTSRYTCATNNPFGNGAVGATTEPRNTLKVAGKYIFGGEIFNASGVKRSAWINGELTNNAETVTGAPAATGIALGARADNGTASGQDALRNTKVCAVAIVKGRLTTDQRQHLEAWMRDRYALMSTVTLTDTDGVSPHPYG